MKRTLENEQSSGSGDSTKFEPAPHNSVFEAEVLTVEQVDSRWKDDVTGELKKNISFKFRVVEEGDFYDRWFWGTVPDWFSEKASCRLRQFTQSILDHDVLPSGFVLDTDDLVGQRCRIIVHAAESKRNPGRMANWVEEVRPTKMGATLVPGKRPEIEEEPFRRDAGEWSPGHWGEYPS